MMFKLFIKDIKKELLWNIKAPAVMQIKGLYKYLNRECDDYHKSKNILEC